jgi:hypothetical protein
MAREIPVLLDLLKNNAEDKLPPVHDPAAQCIYYNGAFSSTAASELGTVTFSRS